jgi:hypothetical protein
MQKQKRNLPEGITVAHVQKIRNFIRQSKAIPQLAKARTYAICLLSNLTGEQAEEFGLNEVIEFLKTSDRFEENSYTPSIYAA